MRSCLPYMQTVQEAAKGKRSMLSYIDMPTKNDCHNALEKNSSTDPKPYHASSPYLQSSTRLAPRRSHHSPSPEKLNFIKKYLEYCGTAFIGFHLLSSLP